MDRVFGLTFHRQVGYVDATSQLRIARRQNATTARGCLRAGRRCPVDPAPGRGGKADFAPKWLAELGRELQKLEPGPPGDGFAGQVRERVKR